MKSKLYWRTGMILGIFAGGIISGFWMMPDFTDMPQQSPKKMEVYECFLAAPILENMELDSYACKEDHFDTDVLIVRFTASGNNISTEQIMAQLLEKLQKDEKVSEVKVYDENNFVQYKRGSINSTIRAKIIDGRSIVEYGIDSY